MKNEFDIVIVGAGPGGSSAAKTAVEKGASVLIIEEHPQVGIPRHCTGLLMGSKFNAEIRAMVGENVMLQPRRAVRVFAPSGKLLKEVAIGGGCCLTNRSELDKQLAVLAVNAGAELKLNTRVTGLLKKNGKILGVATNSKELPEIKANLVIVAGGLTALKSGIPKDESMVSPDEVYVSATMMELANVNGIEADVIEWWYCNFTTTAGCFFLEPVNSRSCIIDIHDTPLEAIKIGNFPFSYKVKDAYPVRIWGTGPSRVNTGMPLPKTYKEGMILIGSAAGFNGIQPAILTGRFAAEVAVDAIRAADVSESRLSVYQQMWEDIGLEHMYDYWRGLRQAMSSLDKNNLELDLEERVKRGEDLITCFFEKYN